MFDFPNSPTVGQRVTGVGGIVYVWDGAKWTSNVGSVTVQSMGDVGRNLVNNSLFNITQRGLGPWTIVGSYTADRWRLDYALDTVVVRIQQYIDAQRTQIGDEQANNALVSDVTGNAGATAFSLISQFIEGVRRTAGKTVTISFWAHATAGTPKIGVGLRQVFGTGGSPSALVDINATPITLTTVPTRYTVTIALPSIIGKVLGTNLDDYLRLGFFLSAGANTNAIAGGIGVQTGVFVFGGMQLEIGTVATPLEKPEPQQDIAKCQRFFQTGTLQDYGYAVAGVTLARSVNLPVAMRVAPTLAVTMTSTVNITGGNIGVISNATLNITGTLTANGSYASQGNFTASADY